MIGLVRRFFSTDRYYYKLFHRLFGVMPHNIDLYKLALVHRSASVVLDDGGLVNNERLEFLGDAVLQSVSSDMLFINYPWFNEGELTRLRSRLVSRENLVFLSKSLGLDAEIITFPPKLQQGHHAVFGDTFEAVIGALYLDKGYDVTRKSVVTLFQNNLNIDKLLSTEEDFKSRVLEWGQKHHQTVEFKSTLIQTDLEDPNFETTLMVSGFARGFGSGRNKKLSEQRASKQFFEEIYE